MTARKAGGVIQINKMSVAVTKPKMTVPMSLYSQVEREPEKPQTSQRKKKMPIEYLLYAQG
jgi:hypothetical protein